MIRILVTEIGWLGQLFRIGTTKSSFSGDLKFSSASHPESSNFVNSGSCDKLTTIRVYAHLGRFAHLKRLFGSRSITVTHIILRIYPAQEHTFGKIV